MTMRVFEFKCVTCDTRYEDSTRESSIQCCEQTVRRVWSAGIQFKGPGFHKNDYKGKS